MRRVCDALIPHQTVRKPKQRLAQGAGGIKMITEKDGVLISVDEMCRVGTHEARRSSDPVQSWMKRAGLQHIAWTKQHRFVVPHGCTWFIDCEFTSEGI